METRPMGPASSSPASKTPASTRSARPSHRLRRTGCSQRTGSRSTLDDDTVTCPADVTVRIGRLRDGTGVAKFGAALFDLPARRAVHHVRARAKGPRRGERGLARTGTRGTGRSEVASRLPSDASEGRAKARPSDATPTRRTASEGAPEAPSCRRLQPPFRRSKPRAPRKARALLDPRRRVGGGWMRATWRAVTSPDRSSGPISYHRPAQLATYLTPQRDEKGAFAAASGRTAITLVPRSTPAT